MTKTLTNRIYECAWCGQRRPLQEMRHPLSSKGKAPSVCQRCRDENPDMGWCDVHQVPHPRSAFTVVNRPIGINNICKAALSARASEKRGHAPITCVSCGSLLGSWNFRGGQQKSPTCRECESDHAGERWCIDCASWLPEDRFHRTGVGGKFWTVRCKPCKIANNHGVTIVQLLERQGVSEPECAVCGSKEELKIDHDHRHCPAQCGCAQCVRGWLCHGCNTAEGLLRTPQRAIALARYMSSYS